MLMGYLGLTACPSVRFACGQDLLPLAEKRYRTELDGQGLGMPITIRNCSLDCGQDVQN